MRSLSLFVFIALLLQGCSSEPESTTIPTKASPAFSADNLSKVEQWARFRLDRLYSQLEKGSNETELKAMADSVTATILEDLKPFVGQTVTWELPFLYTDGRALVLVRCRRKRFAVIPTLVGVVGEVQTNDPNSLSHSHPIELPMTESEAAKYSESEEVPFRAIVDRVELVLVPGKFTGIVGFVIYLYLKDPEVAPD